MINYHSSNVNTLLIINSMAARVSPNDILNMRFNEFIEDLHDGTLQFSRQGRSALLFKLRVYELFDGIKGTDIELRTITRFFHGINNEKMYAKYGMDIMIDVIDIIRELKFISVEHPDMQQLLIDIRNPTEYK